MVYAVAAAAFALWAIVKKSMPTRLAKPLWFVPPTLLLVGSAALFNTDLGGWVAGGVAAVFGWAGGWIGVSAALVAGVIGLVLAVATVFDLLDRKPDGVAKAGLLVLPLLAIIAAGPVAAAGDDLFDRISQGGADGLTRIVGGE